MRTERKNTPETRTPSKKVQPLARLGPRGWPLLQVARQVVASAERVKRPSTVDLRNTGQSGGASTASPNKPARGRMGARSRAPSQALPTCCAPATTTLERLTQRSIHLTKGRRRRNTAASTKAPVPRSGSVAGTGVAMIGPL